MHKKGFEPLIHKKAAFEATAFSSFATCTKFGSEQTRTAKPFGIRTSTWRVFQLHHWTKKLPAKGLEPSYQTATDPKSAVSPIAPRRHLITPSRICTGKPFRQLVLSQSCFLISPSEHKRGRADSNCLSWIFSPVLYLLGYFHIKAGYGSRTRDLRFGGPTR